MKNGIQKKLLEGIRVVDFSRILVGAYCSMMLADLGAEVIKVEPPRGDETRKWGPPFRGEDSLYYLSVNRNKKSISIDLKSSEGQNLAKNLIKKSDILLENFVFGKMKEFSLEYENLKNENKKLIYATVNSYGNSGPIKTHPSFDLIIQSYVGVMNITGGQDTEPYKIGYPACDIMAGSHVYGSILVGLLHRQLTGEGQYINTSLLETNTFAMPNIVSYYLNAGHNSQRRGNDHPTIAPYTVFKLKSGDYLSIGVATDPQFKKLWDCLEITNYDFSDFETNKLRLNHRIKLKEILQENIIKFEDELLFNIFNLNKIPFSKINSTKDLFENNQQIKDLNLVQKIKTEDYGELKYLRNPISYSKIQIEEIKSPPTLGKHTREVLKNILEMNDVEIDNLYFKKVIH
jgi:succinate--hydroxymethylglutarate CoA-transferase